MNTNNSYKRVAEQINRSNLNDPQTAETVSKMGGRRSVKGKSKESKIGEWYKAAVGGALLNGLCRRDEPGTSGVVSDGDR